MPDTLPEMHEAIGLLIGALAVMNNQQRLHGEMLRKVLDILEQPSPEESPLVKFMQQVSAQLADLTILVGRVLALRPNDSELANVLRETHDRTGATA